MTTLNLRLKLTRVNALKLKVLPRFPASIQTGNFLTVASAGGTYNFGVDYTKLGPGPVADPTTAMVVVLDETAGVYKLVSLASLLVSGLDVDLQAIGALTGTGILVRTASGVWAQRTILGTANEITLTNGDGVAGNPTASLPAALTFTGKTVTGGTFNTPLLIGPTVSSQGASYNGSTSGTTVLKGSATASGTLTLPAATDTLVGKATTDTLTNKTISGANNTLTNVPLGSVTGTLAKANGGLGATTLSSALDTEFSSTQGGILYRSASAWVPLAPGTSGQFLKTLGASANPAWASVPGGGDMLSTNNLSDVASKPTAWKNIVQPGAIIDSAYAEYLVNTATTAVIPVDDTIPQNTEGTEIMSVSITPKTTTNKLRVRFEGNAAASAADNIVVAVFVNSNANASAVSRVTSSAANFSCQLVMEAEFVPGATTAQTIHIRVGTGSGSSLAFNGSSSGRIFGGAARTTLVVEEVVA